MGFRDLKYIFTLLNNMFERKNFLKFTNSGKIVDLRFEISRFKGNYLKPSYFSGTLILVILTRGLVITKFNTC